jgi:hypothetical protein
MHNCTQYLIDYLEAAFMAASSLVFWSACNRESSRTESHSSFRLLHLLGENSYFAAKRPAMEASLLGFAPTSWVIPTTEPSIGLHYAPPARAVPLT